MRAPTGQGPTVGAAEFYDRISGRWAEESSRRAPYLDAVDRQVLDWVRSRDVQDVLDIGCGDGRRTLRLLEALDADGVGVDVSERMVAAAVANHLDAHLLDLADPERGAGLLEGRRFGLVTALWNVLGHVPSPAGRERLLLNASKLLTDDGMLVLDVNNRHNAAAYGWRLVARNILTERGADQSRGDFVARRHGPDGTIETTTHLFSRAEITALCEAAGLRIMDVRYLDYARGLPARSRFGGQICVLAAPRAP